MRTKTQTTAVWLLIVCSFHFEINHFWSTDSVFPIVRVPVKVHYGKYENPFRLFGVQNSIRKSSCHASPNILSQGHPGFGISNNSIDWWIYLNCEVVSQSLGAIFIVIDGLVELHFCLGVKWIFHGEKRFQILLNTSSPGTALTSPDRSSAIRRFAIAAHFLSMSESGGFRLLRMESTTIALSSTGSEIASSIKSFVFNLVNLPLLPKYSAIRFDMSKFHYMHLDSFGQ